MFPYDAAIVAAVQRQPQSIADVFQMMKAIDGVCVDVDGLKWFNWLYMRVTEEIGKKAAAGGFGYPAWLGQLDVLFARFYFDAVAGCLSGGSCPQSWRVMLSMRKQANVARIQFAMAGMNAHINHDLPIAIVSTCRMMNTIPRHGTTEYDNYTAVNATLDSLIDEAKHTLHLRLPGDPLPCVSHLENLIATWDLATFREKAWDSAQSLWGEPETEIHCRMELRDAIVATLGATLLVPVP